eukprot:UN00446
MDSDFYFRILTGSETTKHVRRRLQLVDPI